MRFKSRSNILFNKYDEDLKNNSDIGELQEVAPLKSWMIVEIELDDSIRYEKLCAHIKENKTKFDIGNVLDDM